MPEIKVNIIDPLLDKKLRIYMAENDFSSKEKAILDILAKEFKLKKTSQKDLEKIEKK